MQHKENTMTNNTFKPFIFHISRDPLTRQGNYRYADSALEKDGAEFSSLDIQRRTPPLKRFFIVRNEPPMGEPCGTSSDVPGSFVTGLLTRTVSSTHLAVGSENSKRYKGGHHA